MNDDQIAVCRIPQAPRRENDLSILGYVLARELRYDPSRVWVIGDLEQGSVDGVDERAGVLG